MQTPTNQLVYAAGKGYLQDVANFLKNGAKINSTDEQGNTALRTLPTKRPVVTHVSFDRHGSGRRCACFDLRHSGIDIEFRRPRPGG